MARASQLVQTSRSLALDNHELEDDTEEDNESHLVTEVVEHLKILNQYKEALLNAQREIDDVATSLSRLIDKNFW